MPHKRRATCSVVGGGPCGRKSAVTLRCLLRSMAAFTAAASFVNPNCIRASPLRGRSPRAVGLVWPGMSGAERAPAHTILPRRRTVLGADRTDGNMPIEPASNGLLHHSGYRRTCSRSHHVESSAGEDQLHGAVVDSRWSAPIREIRATRCHAPPELRVFQHFGFVYRLSFWRLPRARWKAMRARARSRRAVDHGVTARSSGPLPRCRAAFRSTCRRSARAPMSMSVPSTRWFLAETNRAATCRPDGRSWRRRPSVLRMPQSFFPDAFPAAHCRTRADRPRPISVRVAAKRQLGVSSGRLPVLCMAIRPAGFAHR